ncbi:hypothetical protein FH972_019338 [Carpinus fangiana]|uniref:G-box binding protein multifunctional mosaic region domain-containing protein n=1 Tax=Carpinus fangiana TaxID=176857 RepID=A0A5N6RU71_9ROSI|nr:hypothetical protein FH972_019338 [Carpinus fangiana]
MGIGEESKPPKPSKPSSSTQEIPTTHYFDWSSSMQAYYCPGATQSPSFASTVASTTPHPYLSGSHHPLIPPYGTPIPYPSLLPPWGVYNHPNMTTTPNPLHVNVELEGKGPYGNDLVYAKRSKGTPRSANNEDFDGKADAQSHTVGSIGEASVPPASLALVMGSDSVMPKQLMQACQGIQGREVNPDEALLPSLIDTQYDHIIGAQMQATCGCNNYLSIYCIHQCSCLVFVHIKAPGSKHLILLRAIGSPLLGSITFVYSEQS